VYQSEGRIADSIDAIARAAEHTDPAAPPWVLAWLSGHADRQSGRLAEAAKNFRAVLDTRVPERKFDFSLDYVVINDLGVTLFEHAKQYRTEDGSEQRTALLDEAVATFHRTLEIDPENSTAHYNLQLLYQQLGNAELAEKHRALHQNYKDDDNIRDRAHRLARERYPAADHAAETLVIYPLHRRGAPGLPDEAVTADAR
jgi:tetratricopeptide (TPR) repeat protein